MVRLFPLLLLASVSCAPRQDEPALRQLEPSEFGEAGGPLILRGVGFHPAGTLDFDQPQKSFLRTEVSAELEQGGVRVSLGEVSWVDSTRVDAVVPHGLAAGLWSVHLVTPRGDALRLAEALRVDVNAGADGGEDAGEDAGVDAGEDAGADAGPLPCELLTYLDEDADGFGVPGSGALLCGPGRVLLEADCNDVDALSSPAGREVCNELDDDCDGTVDEGCADAGFIRLRDAGTVDYFSTSAWAPDQLWIAGGSRLLVVDGDAGLIDSSANCPTNMRAVWAMPSGRAFVGGGNNGVGRLATATRGTGCQQSELIPEPVVGMVGFPSADGGVRLEAVLRDGRRAAWDGTGAVQISGAVLPPGFVLFDAHGSAPGVLYAVGGTTGTPPRPAVFRLQPDGGFVSEPLPAQNVQDGQLHGVWVLSADEVVAVGDEGLVLRRVQGAWQRVDPPSTADYTTVRAFSIGRFYLSTEFGYLRQWSGRWSLQYTDQVPVRDLTAWDEEHFWLVGDDEVIIKGP